MRPQALPRWVDGRLLPASEAFLPLDDGATTDGLACYTTAAVRRGRVRWLERHIERLLRDARLLALPAPHPFELRHAFVENARAAFPNADGALRIQVSAGRSGRARVIGLPRPLGDDPPLWRAVRTPWPHPGPRPWRGAKVAGAPDLALARALAHASGAQEALQVDRDGRVLEGARSALVVVRADGEIVTPDPARGGVVGLARAVVLERLPDVRVRDVSLACLAGAREVLALNAVRGVRPLVALDDRPLGAFGARAGPVAQRLAALLESE